MTAILTRLREPSSWAGIAALLGVFGIQIAPEVMQGAIQAATAIAGLLAVVMRERAA